MPFQVDHKLCVNIATQVTDGIRQAILSGFYKPGDLLPKALGFTRGLHVSIRAIQAAYRTLKKEGLISSWRGMVNSGQWLVASWSAPGSAGILPAEDCAPASTVGGPPLWPEGPLKRRSRSLRRLGDAALELAGLAVEGKADGPDGLAGGAAGAPPFGISAVGGSFLLLNERFDTILGFQDHAFLNFLWFGNRVEFEYAWFEDHAWSAT